MVLDVGGAGLGAAIGFLLERVKEITEKNVMFKPSLESLKATLEILKPLMDEVNELNEVLNQRQEESAYYESQIKEGEKYVLKCSKVCRCNIFKKCYYTDKLLELDRTLKSLIVAGLLARDSKETLIWVRNIFHSLKSSSGSSASVSNEILSLVRELREIVEKIQGEPGINIVEPADQVISKFSSHTPHPPLNIEQEIEPELPPPLTKTPTEPPPPPPPPSLSEPPPTPPFTQNSDTKSHNYKLQEEPAGRTTFGPAVGSLLDAVEKFEGTSTGTMKPVIRKVRATLGVLVPLVSQIEKFHPEPDMPNGQTIRDLKLELEEAAKLIQKCSNVSRFNLLKKKHYTDMLLRLDETLFRWVQILQIQLARDVKKSLVLIREIHAHIVEHGGINDVGLNQILSRVSSINVTSSSPTV